MITEKQWYAHPSFSTELAELLKHPVLAAALELCKDLGLKSTSFPVGTDLRDFFALHGAKKDGYREAFIQLEDLSKPKPMDAPPQEPWKTPPGADADTTSAP